MRSCETQKDTASERFTFCLPCVCNIFLCISNVTAAAINRQNDRCRPSYKAHYRLPFLEFSSDSLSVKSIASPCYRFAHVDIILIPFLFSLYVGQCLLSVHCACHFGKNVHTLFNLFVCGSGIVKSE